MIETLSRIQGEAWTWTQKNFPGQTPWQPLLGVCEELGELSDAYIEAMSGNDFGETKDAIGDAAIFLVNFCSHVKIDVASALALPASTPPDRHAYRTILRAVAGCGAIVHAYLKDTQGIRGGGPGNRAKMEGGIRNLIANLSAICTTIGTTLEQVVAETWDVVKQRDWTKNPLTGATDAGTESVPPVDEGVRKSLYARGYRRCTGYGDEEDGLWFRVKTSGQQRLEIVACRNGNEHYVDMQAGRTPSPADLVKAVTAFCAEADAWETRMETALHEVNAVIKRHCMPLLGAALASDAESDAAFLAAIEKHDKGSVAAKADAEAQRARDFEAAARRVASLRAGKVEAELEEYRLRLAGVLTVLDGAPPEVAPKPGSGPDVLSPCVSSCPTYAAAWRLRERLDAVTAQRDSAQADLQDLKLATLAALTKAGVAMLEKNPITPSEVMSAIRRLAGVDANRISRIIRAIGGMLDSHGMHGPCSKNSCRDCRAAYEAARQEKRSLEELRDRDPGEDPERVRAERDSAERELGAIATALGLENEPAPIDVIVERIGRLFDEATRLRARVATLSALHVVCLEREEAARAEIRAAWAAFNPNVRNVGMTLAEVIMAGHREYEDKELQHAQAIAQRDSERARANKAEADADEWYLLFQGEEDRREKAEAEVKRLTERHPSAACEEWHYADAAALRKINEEYIVRMRELGARVRQLEAELVAAKGTRRG